MALRVPLRLLGLVILTVPLYLGWVLTRPLAWMFAGAEQPLQRIWIGSWARGCLWIMGVRVTVEGPVPEGAYFLVANHLSYVDIPVLLSRLDARFLAKSEVAGWPILGLLARSTGTLFVDRSRKRDLTRVLPAIRAVLDRGPGVIVFPEGTSTDGAEVATFKPSLFQVPVEMGLPVTCAALHYNSPQGPLPAWEAVCWWGDAPFGPHFLQFLRQGPTEAQVIFSTESIRAGEGVGPGRRKELARTAQSAIELAFTPSRTPPDSAEPPLSPSGTPAHRAPHS